MTVGRGVMLQGLFSELADRWLDAAPTRQAVLDEPLRRELTLPRDTPTRICFFSVPRTLLPQYKETVFPLAEDVGLVPTAGDDAIAPGGNVLSVIASLLERAAVVIVDFSHDAQRARSDLLSASSRRNPPHIAVIIEGRETQLPQFGTEGVFLLRRDEELTTDVDATPDWIQQLSGWLSMRGPATQAAVEDEPLRLLDVGMYRAALVAAVTALEIALRQGLEIRGIPPGPYSSGRKSQSRAPLSVLLDTAARHGLIGPADLAELHEIQRTRDQLVHTDTSIDGRRARPMVERVLRVIGSLGSATSSSSEL